MRVRFAPSPTGFLHIGSARTFAFNWLYARRNGGTMILRIDDTDLQRNTDESLASIFDGLRWLELDWDEEYRQSDRVDLHRRMGEQLLSSRFAYRDFAPAQAEGAGGAERGTPPALFNPDARALSVEESNRRAAAGEPFVIRFRVPREPDRNVTFDDAVFGPQAKSTADLEDFALVRSNGTPTYHLASCADDVDLRITEIIRGQDHLANTFKHVLIFDALGFPRPRFAHLPLLVAPDGAKLSKRRHGAVVSINTYRDAGFLPQGFLNFLVLLGWSPKDGREVFTREDLIAAFNLESVNRSNAMVNFTEADPIDPKALWVNAQNIYALPVDALTDRLVPVLAAAGFRVDRERMLGITRLIQTRIRTLNEALQVADFLLIDELPPYDASLLVPAGGDAALALEVLTRARATLADLPFDHETLHESLRAESKALGIKAGQMFTPIRVAICGRNAAPPLFETLEVLGRERSLERIDRAIAQLQRTANNLPVAGGSSGGGGAAARVVARRGSAVIRGR